MQASIKRGFMNTRPAAVAGMFYPAAADELQTLVNQLLADNKPKESLTRHIAPRVLIVPHAGYIYSGGIAAQAYNLLSTHTATIKRVMLLGPSHRVALHGMALPSCDAFETPLGPIKLDTETITKLKLLPEVNTVDAAHAQEHSLEVQLPFLQTVLTHFSLIPVVVGDTSPEAVKALINSCWHEDTLIVISSDLSHFLPYSTATTVDKETLQHILSYDSHLAGEQACGCRPLNGLLLAATEKDLDISLINYCNSGDTAGDKNSVVGYATFSLY